jgi:Mn-dependent DtxR family transcriptional regulator
MTHDRGSASQFPITHEFLAELLGVRRSSVSDIVGPLQDVGLLQYHRGKNANS